MSLVAVENGPDTRRRLVRISHIAWSSFQQEHEEVVRQPVGADRQAGQPEPAVRGKLGGQRQADVNP